MYVYFMGVCESYRIVFSQTQPEISYISNERKTQFQYLCKRNSESDQFKLRYKHIKVNKSNSENKKCPIIRRTVLHFYIPMLISMHMYSDFESIETDMVKTLLTIPEARKEFFEFFCLKVGIQNI